ncbi:Crp/Fnr family transcriptional regulator [Virgibacillus kimchii]
MAADCPLDKMWYLSKIGFFDFLPLHEVKKIAPMIVHNNIAKNSIIQTPDSAEKKLYFVKTGAIRIYDMKEDGSIFTLSLLGPYSTYGSISLFSLGTEQVYAETLSQVHLCSISEKDFTTLLQTYPELLTKAMQLLSDRLKKREKMLEIIATENVKEQLKHLLFSMADTYGKEECTFVTIPIPLSHQEIANMLGVTRESVSTNIHQLKREGFIRSSGRKTIQVNQNAIKNPISLSS